MTLWTTYHEVTSDGTVEPWLSESPLSEPSVIPVVLMYNVPKNGTYAENREVHNEAWILYTIWLKLAESFESLVEYFCFIPNINHFVQEN